MEKRLSLFTFSLNSNVYFRIQIVGVCRRKIAGTQITLGASLSVSRALFPFTSTRNRMTVLIGVAVGAGGGGAAEYPWQGDARLLA